MKHCLDKKYKWLKFFQEDMQFIFGEQYKQINEKKLIEGQLILLQTLYTAGFFIVYFSQSTRFFDNSLIVGCLILSSLSLVSCSCFLLNISYNKEKKFISRKGRFFNKNNKNYRIFVITLPTILCELLKVSMIFQSQDFEKALEVFNRLEPFLSCIGFMLLYLMFRRFQNDSRGLSLTLIMFISIQAVIRVKFFLGLKSEQLAASLCWQLLTLLVLSASLIIKIIIDDNHEIFRLILSKILLETPSGLLLFDSSDRLIITSNKINKYIFNLPDQETVENISEIESKLKGMTFKCLTKVLHNSALRKRTWIQGVDKSYTIEKTLNLKELLHDQRLNCGQETKFYTSIEYDAASNKLNTSSGRIKSSQGINSNPDSPILKPINSIVENNLDTSKDHGLEDKQIDQRDFKVSCRKIYAGSNRVITLMIFSDVSTAKIMGEEDVGKTFKSNVLNTFSHELRTPLNQSHSILSCAAKDNDISEEVKEMYIQKPLNSLSLMNYLVHDIVDYLKFDTKQLVPNIEYFSVRELLKEVVQLVEPKAKEKDLKLEIFIDHEIHSEVRSDKERLARVLINFLLSCIKYTYHGIVSLKLTKAQDPEHLAIEISDTRFLYSDEIVERNEQPTDDLLPNQQSYNMANLIDDQRDFNLFINKLHLGVLLPQKEAFTWTHTGTGISFKLCFEISFPSSTVNANNIINPIYKNQKYVTSIDEGLVALNLMELNTKRNDLEEHCTEALSQGKSIVSRAWSTDCHQVLIVDDDTFNLTALEMLMNKKRIRVSKALNGRIAIDMAQDCYEQHKYCQRENCCKGFACVFMDLNMPVMNGFESTKIMIELQEEGLLNDFPIIACSANDSKEDLVRVLGGGMKGHVAKPLTSQKLDQTLLFLKQEMGVTFDSR